MNFLGFYIPPVLPSSHFTAADPPRVGSPSQGRGRRCNGHWAIRAPGLTTSSRRQRRSHFTCLWTPPHGDGGGGGGGGSYPVSHDSFSVKALEALRQQPERGKQLVECRPRGGHYDHDECFSPIRTIYCQRSRSKECGCVGVFACVCAWRETKVTRERGRIDLIVSVRANIRERKTKSQQQRRLMGQSNWVFWTRGKKNLYTRDGCSLTITWAFSCHVSRVARGFVPC